MVGVGAITIRQQNSRKAKTKCLQKMNDILKVSKVGRKAKPDSTSVMKGNKSCSKPSTKFKSDKKIVSFSDDELLIPSAPGSRGDETDQEFVLPRNKQKIVNQRRQSMEKSQERLRSIIDSKISDDESGGSDEECSMRCDSASLGRSWSQSQDRMDGSRESAAYRSRKKLSCRNFLSSETASQLQANLRPTYLMEYLQRVKTWSKKSEDQAQNSTQTQTDFNKDNNTNKNGEQNNAVVVVDVSDDDDVVILDD